MEEKSEEKERVEKITGKKKEKNGCSSEGRLRIKQTTKTELMKLAAIAVDLNVRVRSVNMPVSMQERAFRLTNSLLDTNSQPKLRPTQIALAIKKEFDSLYGPAWHCIVGKSFGSFVTHSPGGFLYYSIDNLFFLLFQTEVRPVVVS